MKIIIPVLISLSSFSNAAITATFDINTQASPSDPAILNSITIDQIVYSTFIAPTSYENISFGGTVSVSENASTAYTYSNTDLNWDSEVTAAFQSNNLNYYQQVDEGNSNSVYRLNFDNFTFTDDVYILATERNGNNTFQIEAFDEFAQSLGIINVDTNDYQSTGAFSLSTDGTKTESIEAVVYNIRELVGANADSLAYLEITNTDINNDGADGKLFFVESSSVVPEPSSAILLGLGAMTFSLRRFTRRTRS
ncbi:MAG: PEP-CTERM sorting domain-containing protein [Akkermansiaceae bacterium]